MLTMSCILTLLACTGMTAAVSLTAASSALTASGPSSYSAQHMASKRSPYLSGYSAMVPVHHGMAGPSMAGGVRASVCCIASVYPRRHGAIPTGCPPRASLRCSALPQDSAGRDDELDRRFASRLAPQHAEAHSRLVREDAELEVAINSGSYFHSLGTQIKTELVRHPRIATTLAFMISNLHALVEEVEVQASGSLDAIRITGVLNEFLRQLEWVVPLTRQSRAHRDDMRVRLAAYQAEHPDAAQVFTVADALYRRAFDYEQLAQHLLDGVSPTDMSETVRSALLSVVESEGALLQELAANDLIHRPSEDYPQSIHLAPIRKQMSWPQVEQLIRGAQVGKDPVLTSVLRAAWDVLSVVGEGGNAHDPSHADEAEAEATQDYHNSGFFDVGYSEESQSAELVPSSPIAGFHRDAVTGETILPPRRVLTKAEHTQARELDAIGRDIFYLELFHHTLVEEALPEHLAQPWKWWEVSDDHVVHTDAIRTYQARIAPSMQRGMRDTLRTFLRMHLSASIPAGYRLPSTCLHYEAERYLGFLGAKVRAATTLGDEEREQIEAFITFVRGDLRALHDNKWVGSLRTDAHGRMCTRAIMSFFGEKFP
jgi:hypothetical protein